MKALAGLPAVLALGALAFAWHISVGARAVPIGTVFEALVAFDGAELDHVVVRDLRLARAIYAALVGAALAVAGALMQGVTRNPLAEPGILGLLVGASFAVVIGIGYLGLASTAWLPVFAAVGALAAAVIVWSVAQLAPGGGTPLTLVLAGTAVSAFLAAFITLAQLLDSQTFEQLRIWLTGGFSGRNDPVFYAALPWLLLGFALALGIARQVTALSMGEDTAAGLGVDVARLKALALAAVVALTAASVAIAGPLGFVGLVIPHVARLLVGADYRAILPFSAAIGAGYLLCVDVVARIAFAPLEISTGLMTALLGAPFFVWLVRARL